ncbi:DUF6285 domain-containing protein [Piscinibacter koreensis]|uniref:DUF6285 domain-containing protein n=1 Tax=Piscinibacter koreensis TaxID=2742824 RepID=A0A7Y6TWM2_9BURK|nr:DUF6285 domain-containing protein [Schlegelella koreensis]NUZ06141.1 hypothetical protein [Schlegelella koreensis]
MTRSIPDAAVLLGAVADYLESELLPTLAGYHRFQTRVAANVLRTLGREAQLGATHDAAEGERLRALLGHAGEVPALRRELAVRIADGTRAIDDPRLLEHLERTLADALRVNNPDWIGDAEAGAPHPSAR